MKAWLVYDHERAQVNSWLINHYQDRAPHHGIDLSLVFPNDAHEALAAGQLPDVAIMRCIDLPLHRAMEAAGVRVYNSARVSEITNNKATCYEFARKLGVPVLDFQLVSDPKDATQDFAFPVVVKPLDGHGGHGVHLITTQDELQEYWDKQQKVGEQPPFLLQELADAPGRDVRVYVLSNEVLAAVERRAQEGQLRANFTLGGSAELIDMTPAMRECVEKITAALPLDFAGIDFLYHDGGVVLGEIEDVVGARMLYELTEFDVVDEYLDLIVRNHAS